MKKMFVIEPIGKSNNKLSGEYGIITKEGGIMTKNQLETLRRTFIRKIKSEGGKMWIRVVADKTLTNKPNEVRMGKGKGSVKRLYVPLKEGSIIVEFSNVKERLIKECWEIINKKLGISTTIVKNINIKYND